MAGSIIQLYRLIICIHRDHLQGRARLMQGCGHNLFGPHGNVSPLSVSTPQFHTADKSQLSGGERRCCPDWEPEKRIPHLRKRVLETNIQMRLWGRPSTPTRMNFALPSPDLTQLGFVKRGQGVPRHYHYPAFVAVLPQRFSANESSRAWNYTLSITLFLMMPLGNHHIYHMIDISLFSYLLRSGGWCVQCPVFYCTSLSSF